MKKEFRKKVIETRSLQNIELINSNSELITSQLLNMDCIKDANTIMLYLDFNNEVKTDLLIEKLNLQNKKVLAPVTLKKERKLLPHQILNLDEDINIGAFGIREPNSNTCPFIDVSDIDLLIVPAVAYDKNKFRLGYGGGFYDRFIETLRPNCITVGICFDIQLFDSVPIEPHDAKLDYIVTESQIIY